MTILERKLSLNGLHGVEGGERLIFKRAAASDFSSMLNSIIINQNTPIQAAAQDSSDTACDCNETKKCMCESDTETKESSETKKTGLAACMDCSFRKSGQCAMWKKDDFDMFMGNSQDTPMAQGTPLLQKRLDFQPDFAAMSEAWLDYTNAYAYITKKQLGILEQTSQ